MAAVNNVAVSNISAVQQTLLSELTITTTGSATGTLVGMDAFSTVDLQLRVRTVSGTTPTLDFYVQKVLGDGVTVDDLIHFGQMTTNASSVATITAGNNGVHAQQSKALAASTVQTTGLGGQWQLAWTVGGSTPSFSVTLFGDCYV